MNHDQIRAEALAVEDAIKTADESGCLAGLSDLQPIILAGHRQAWSATFVLAHVCIAALRDTNPGSPDRELVLDTDTWTTGGPTKIRLVIETPTARRTAAALVNSLIRTDLLGAHNIYSKAVVAAPCKDCFILQVAHVLLHAVLSMADTATCQS
jgi:hypothetical protein